MILFNPGNVGVAVLYLHQGFMLSGNGPHNDIQIAHIPDQFYLTDLFRHQLLGFFDILRGNTRKNLQLLFTVSGKGAQNGAGVDSFHIAGGRHNDAFDVFDDVTAALNNQPLRHTAQHLSGLRRGKGDGNGLGTAQSRDQFFLKKRGITFAGIFVQHIFSLSP